MSARNKSRGLGLCTPKKHFSLSSPMAMPSFAELSVDDITSFCFCNSFYRYTEVRVMFDHVTCIYVW